jgi:hypothetical protein
MTGRLTTAVLLLAASANISAAANERDIEKWLAREAVPFVKTALLEHPRFKGETVMFVVLDDNATATTSNELALSLRDRLLDAALDTPGVTIAWRQGRSNAHHGTEAIDCTRDDVDYYIGIELSQQLDNSYSLSLRALDLQERSWISGFGTSWRGSLSMTQRRAYRHDKVDVTFLGARDVPFTSDQNDLLARYLAHELSCALLRETNGDYIIPADLSADSSAESADRVDNTIELVSNNIAANDAIELTADSRTANAEISGKAHQIDDQLFQYWLTVTPKGTDSELSSLSVSAYVLKPDARYAVPARTTVAMPGRQRGELIGRSSFSSDAVVFYIQNQPHLGLVRLDSGVCRDRTMAMVVRAGDPIQFPVTYAHSLNSETIDTDEWYVTPIRDTYYAIAISDEKAARRMANHLDSLPIRCGASTRRGLSGQALNEWLDEFAALAAASAQHIDWRAVEIKDLL